MWVIDLPSLDVGTQLALHRSSAAAGPHHPFVGTLFRLLQFGPRFFAHTK